MVNRYYMDIYHNGHRTWETLGIMLSSDPAVSMEQHQLAEIVNTLRQIEMR